MAVECLTAEIAESEERGTTGEFDACDAGQLADGLFGCAGFVERGSGGWQFVGEDEAGEGAVQVAAGADAFDDLLAEIAAFAEVEGAGGGTDGGGLLGEVFVTNVYAEERCAFGDAELVEGFGVREDRTVGEECGGEGGDGCVVGPELKAGDEGAVGLEEGDGTGELDEGEGREGGGVYAGGGEDGGGVRAGEKEAGLVLEGLELDVVHDDEALEVGDERRELVAGGFEEDRVGFEKDGGVGLDAALGVEEEGVAAVAGGEGLDGVGGHAVEPADTVVSGDAEPGGFVQGDQGRGGEQRHGAEGGAVCLIVRSGCERAHRPDCVFDLRTLGL